VWQQFFFRGVSKHEAALEESFVRIGHAFASLAPAFASLALRRFASASDAWKWTSMIRLRAFLAPLAPNSPPIPSSDSLFPEELTIFFNFLFFFLSPWVWLAKKFDHVGLACMKSFLSGTINDEEGLTAVTSCRRPGDVFKFTLDFRSCVLELVLNRSSLKRMGWSCSEAQDTLLSLRISKSFKPLWQLYFYGKWAASGRVKGSKCHLKKITLFLEFWRFLTRSSTSMCNNGEYFLKWGGYFSCSGNTAHIFLARFEKPLFSAIYFFYRHILLLYDERFSRKGRNYNRNPSNHTQVPL